jgi:hypothetical protein
MSDHLVALLEEALRGLDPVRNADAYKCVSDVRAALANDLSNVPTDAMVDRAADVLMNSDPRFETSDEIARAMLKAALEHGAKA